MVLLSDHVITLVSHCVHQHSANFCSSVNYYAKIKPHNTGQTVTFSNHHLCSSLHLYLTMCLWEVANSPTSENMVTLSDQTVRGSTLSPWLLLYRKVISSFHVCAA